ncbi:MAG: ATP-binding cassette domain-containing protein [Vicinamibacterales bacterium]
MRLVVDVSHLLDRFRLEVAFEAGDGMTALLGESGAGKTSLLNVIAGLVRPDRGRVVLDGDVLTDTGAGRFVPPHQRRIGYVFQESRLFPHLTVRQNLGFGRWFTRGVAANGPVPADIVGLLDLEALLPRHPSKLSGGEQRRVALGRALLAHPRLLLLDEPLGSVDVARRQEILPYLDRLIAELKLPMIYVTHDEREIEGRASRVVRVRQGMKVG